jgi:hypothetical protein
VVSTQKSFYCEAGFAHFLHGDKPGSAIGKLSANISNVQGKGGLERLGLTHIFTNILRFEFKMCRRYCTVSLLRYSLPRLILLSSMKKLFPDGRAANLKHFFGLI